MKKKIFPIEEIINLIEKKDYTTSLLAEHFKTSRPTIEKFLRENQIQTNFFYQRKYEKFVELSKSPRAK